MKKIVLIPAYKPDHRLINVVESLYEKGFFLVVVDDGSGEPYKSIFDSIVDKADIVHIPNNSGKGAALKHGMAYISENHSDCTCVITADADGQHKAEDIVRVSKELDTGADFVLTMRKFSKNMPRRSAIGNSMSRWIYTILNGHYFSDNQSGLRGFQAKHLHWLVMVQGNKYDYEMNMLYHLDKQGIPITTIPIEAIYIDNNSSSHFDPVKDTLRIYTQLFYSARVTFSTFILVQLMLILTTVLVNYDYLYITIPTIGAVSTLTNILLNNFVVFRKFKYRDAARVVAATVLRYIIYTLFCFIAKAYVPFIPLFFTFNICAVCFVPLEYLFYKYTYLSKYKDINKQS